YQECLDRLGVRVVSLPAIVDLPDSVFVEDAAVVIDELAVLARMGAPSRRPESAALQETISRHRSVNTMTEPATLDGGDVLRIGRQLFVGKTQRTNLDGINQLRELVRPHGYTVELMAIND